MLQFVTLASGSSGNSYYFTNGVSGVIIDCGISARQIIQRMDQVGFGSFPIDAVLITHGHSDHIAAAKKLEKRLLQKQRKTIPFFISRPTIAFADDRCLPENIRIIQANEMVQIGTLLVEAYPVSHDAPGSLAYRVGYKGYWGGVITDLGQVDRIVLSKMRTLSIMALEFNHDETMLMNGRYPYHLKQRVLGPQGHLSNRQAAHALSQVVSPTLQHLILVHLSENNNRPELAYSCAIRSLKAMGYDDIQVSVASQHDPLPPISISTSLNNENNHEVVVPV